MKGYVRQSLFCPQKKELNLFMSKKKNTRDSTDSLGGSIVSNFM